MIGPRGGELYEEPITLYIRTKGWITCWTEIHTPGGAIVKRAYERKATDDEVFTAQMNKEGK